MLKLTLHKVAGSGLVGREGGDQAGLGVVSHATHKT